MSFRILALTGAVAAVGQLDKDGGYEYVTPYRALSPCFRTRGCGRIITVG